MLTHYTVPGPVTKLKVITLTEKVLNVTWGPPVTPTGVLTRYSVVVTDVIESRDVVNTTVLPEVQELNISVGIGE